MKIYISIPMSGHDPSCQLIIAKKTAELLVKKGHEVFNPFDAPKMPPGMSGDEKSAYAFYMGEDIKTLLQCDAMFSCQGWESSRGCRIERYAAQEMKLKVYTKIDDVPYESELEN